MKKRLLALVLSCVLCLGMLPAALAISNDPVNGPQAPNSGSTDPNPPKPPTPSTPSTDSGSSGGSGSDSRLPINVPASTTGGKIKVNPHSADKGDTVTITVTPDSGYEVGTVTVRDSKGSEVEVKKQSENTYTFEMPNSKVSIDVDFIRVGGAAPATGFTDVPGSAYYAGAVQWAVANGITYGTTSTTFSPNNPCTRGQIVAFLWRAAGSPAASGTNPFTDVPQDAYYYDAVLWAVANGITTGTSATTFSPNNACTRGQTVTFLYRYEKSPAVTAASSFTDVAAGAYYADAVAWAVANGITNGTSATTFGPDNTCTRGNIVTFLYRDMA